jgi:type I restriction enzyme M protein
LWCANAAKTTPDWLVQLPVREAKSGESPQECEGGVGLTEEQKRRLEQHLWNIANTLRGRMDADEFRDYILGFIFYKYLSEKMYAYANRILEQDEMLYLPLLEGDEEGEAIIEAVKEETVAELGYFLRPSDLFGELAKRGAAKGKEGASTFILDDLTRILNNIEKSTMGTASEDDFDKLFEDLDLTSTKLGRTEKAKNEVIVKVLTHLNEIDFELYKSDSDVLGDAYEYLIGKFAAGAGKKAGEFYTPREVSTVLARIVTTGKGRLKSVYDPTCGSGSLLLRVAREAENSDAVEFFGQERNRTTYNLARMNMLLHGAHYTRFDIRQEDTLEHPQHPLDMRFEAVVANPPFSANWSANVTLESDDRFSQYGRLAPASKADFAFVQHMLHYLDDNGTMAVILPHGALFRGGAEAHIREFLIREKNWLDAVIGLPPNIFYGTSIPTCILVFKKCREHPDDVLFVDASGDYGKAKNQNFLREDDVKRIISTYRERKSEPKYSHRANVVAEIAGENDYNLNIPRYVDTFEEEELVDLDAVTSELAALEENVAEIDAKIASYCDELGIKAPV